MSVAGNRQSEYIGGQLSRHSPRYKVSGIIRFRLSVASNGHWNFNTKISQREIFLKWHCMRQHQCLHNRLDYTILDYTILDYTILDYTRLH